MGVMLDLRIPATILLLGVALLRTLETTCGVVLLLVGRAADLAVLLALMKRRLVILHDRGLELHLPPVEKYWMIVCFNHQVRTHLMLGYQARKQLPYRAPGTIRMLNLESHQDLSVPGL